MKTILLCLALGLTGCAKTNELSANQSASRTEPRSGYKLWSCDFIKALPNGGEALVEPMNTQILANPAADSPDSPLPSGWIQSPYSDPWALIDGSMIADDGSGMGYWAVIPL